MEKGREGSTLLTLDPHTDNYMTKIEQAISKGVVVLFQNVDENIDAALEPVLNKSIKKLAGKYTLMMGSKEILYDENFRLYNSYYQLTASFFTNLSSPNFSFTKIIVANLTLSGLIALIRIILYNLSQFFSHSAGN